MIPIASIVNLFVKIVLIFVAITFGLLLVEGLLRLTHQNFQLSHDWMIGAASRTRNSRACFINPDFLEKLHAKRIKGQKKIIALGDSFTEGYPVWGYGYPEELQKRIQEKWGNIETLNFGFGDSGPDQQLRIFKELILPSIKPDMVIWSFYTNDIRDNVDQAMYTISPSNTLEELDCRLSFLYVRNFIDTLSIPTLIKSHSLLYRLILKSTEILINARIPKEYKKQPDLWGYKKIELEISEMKKLAQRYKFELYFITIAPQSIYLENLNTKKLLYEDSNTDYVRLLQAIHDTGNETSNIDLNFNKIGSNEAQLIQEVSTDYGTKLFTEEKQETNPLGDRHFNKLGYQLFADRVYEKIRLDIPLFKNLMK